MRGKEVVSPQLPSGIKVKWDGIFDAEAVYKKMKYWLDFNGFGNNFEEEEYSEVVQGDRKIIGVRWHTEKLVTDYFAYVIDVNIFMPRLQEITVPRNNINIKMSKGSFECRLAAYVMTDYKENFKSKLAQGFYEKFVVKSRLDEHKRLIAILLYQFQEEIKRFLAMP